MQNKPKKKKINKITTLMKITASKRNKMHQLRTHVQLEETFFYLFFKTYFIQIHLKTNK